MQVNVNKNIFLAGFPGLKRYFNTGIDNSQGFCFKSKPERQTFTADLHSVLRFN